MRGSAKPVVNLTVCSAGGARRGSWSPWMGLSSVRFEKQDPDRWFAELELSGVPGAPFRGAPMPVTHQSAIFGHSSVNKQNAHNRERGVWFYYARGCRRAHTLVCGGSRTDTFQDGYNGGTIWPWLRTAL